MCDTVLDQAFATIAALQQRGINIPSDVRLQVLNEANEKQQQREKRKRNDDDDDDDFEEPVAVVAKKAKTSKTVC